MQCLAQTRQRHGADGHLGCRLRIQDPGADQPVAVTDRVEPVRHTRVVDGDDATEDAVWIEPALMTIERGLPQIELLGLPEVVHDLERPVPALGRAKLQDRGLIVADPVAASRDLRELGGYVAATQEITRWAIAGVRFDLYDPDADAAEQRAFARVPKEMRFTTWSFMAALRYEGLRLIAEYDHRKNPLGRDATGSPASLADDSFTLRAAAGF